MLLATSQQLYYLSKGCTGMSKEDAFTNARRRLYKGCCCQFQQGGGCEAGRQKQEQERKWNVCKTSVCVWSCWEGFGSHINLWPDILTVVLVFLQCDYALVDIMPPFYTEACSLFPCPTTPPPTPPPPPVGGLFFYIKNAICVVC